MIDNETRTAVNAAAMNADPVDLIREYTPMIHKLIRNWEFTLTKYPDKDADDLFQVCVMALLDTKRTFDPERQNAFFPTAAHWKMRNAIRDELHIFFKYNPDGSKILSAPPIPSSLETPLSDETTDTLKDTIPDPAAESGFQSADDSTEAEYIAAIIKQELRTLTSRERNAITDHYLNGFTFKEIAQKNQKSFQNVAQGEKNGIRHLRSNARLKDLAVEIGIIKPEDFTPVTFDHAFDSLENWKRWNYEQAERDLAEWKSSQAGKND